MVRMILIVFVLGSLMACGGQKEEKQVRLSYNERKVVDTLYRERVKILGFEMDTLCDLEKESLLESIIDSIKLVRKQEEIELLQRSVK